MADALDIVFLGLSITSSWGNGHATTYRGLVRELVARGHRVLFLERDVPWYAENRDLPQPPFGQTELYNSLDELRDCWAEALREADLVIVGSYVPEGVAVGEWVAQISSENRRGATAFYDIDTPVTLAKLERGDEEYLSRALIARYDAYFSFSGGPILQRLEREFGAQRAYPLYCSFDPELYFVEAVPSRYDLGYLGTYSADRQPPLDALLIETATKWTEGRFCVAGPQYPPDIVWPSNVERISHLPPSAHREFYNAQRWTLNITRADMIRAGYSPSVRLFEAAACGTPIISDAWPGLDSFFALGQEIIVAQNAADVLRCLRDVDEEQRRAIGERARLKVLSKHTAAHRAAEVEGYAHEILARKRI